ncbi:MAG: tRNA lysidine(34) synthetase TilS [Betaproteobacteria bacterium]
MASSRKSRRSSGVSPHERVAAALKGLVKADDRLVVGLSGGIDSVVLLDILARVASRLRFELAAVHVNHRLSPNAPRWAKFCRTLCRARGIPLQVIKVAVKRGNSLEAAAREARYAVFAQRRADYVVLAHNQDDQAETLLLQLLRGAGVKGLAGMPRLAHQGRVRSSSSLGAVQGKRRAPAVLRPLLDVPRSAVEAYAKKRKLEWIDDESNAETYFLRNFLRHEVLPVIARRYSAYRQTLSRSAGNLAEAAQLLDELAAADLHAHMEDGALPVAALRAFRKPRAKNLLRCFIARHGIGAPPAERLDEALRQLFTARTDARVLIDLQGAELRRFAGKVYLVKSLPKDARLVRRWRGETEIDLPQLGGVLVLARDPDRDGISLARLQGREVTIATRAGGERLQPDGSRPRRTLKNLFQEARMPPWQRDRVPLLYCDGHLVWAAGIGVDCAYRSTGNEPALRPLWRPV